MLEILLDGYLLVPAVYAHLPTLGYCQKLVFLVVTPLLNGAFYAGIALSISAVRAKKQKPTASDPVHRVNGLG